MPQAHRLLSGRRLQVPPSLATAPSTRSRILCGGALEVNRVAREMTSLRASNSALMSSAALMSCAPSHDVCYILENSSYDPLLVHLNTKESEKGGL